MGRPCRRSRRVGIQQLRQLQDGEEIYLMLRSAADPDAIQVSYQLLTKARGHRCTCVSVGDEMMLLGLDST